MRRGNRAALLRRLQRLERSALRPRGGRGFVATYRDGYDAAGEFRPTEIRIAGMAVESAAAAIEAAGGKPIFWVPRNGRE